MFTFRHGDKPLDGYTVLRGLGRGGFGEVYYAVSDGGREVALKVIQQNHDVELRGVGQCMNLKSPHLVTIFDVRHNEHNVPFVIMEYVAGPSFRDFIREHPKGIGQTKACYLVREIARGLGDLHNSGIVHRDLKPENIFLEDGTVKIGDYGLSKHISVSQHSGQTISVGTVHYMAPEIGSGNYQRGIDIYALGIILYELLTGRVPYEGDSMGEILMKHLSAEPDLEDVDPALRPVIQKALAKKPADRYQTVEGFIEHLLAIHEVEAALVSFDPASLASSTVPVRSPLPPPLESSDPEPAKPAATAAPPGSAKRPRHESTDSPERFTGGSDWQRRVVLGLSTAVAMSFGISLLFRNGPPVHTSLISSALAILTGSMSILLVGCFLAPRLGIEPGFARRLIHVAVAFPILTLMGLVGLGAASYGDVLWGFGYGGFPTYSVLIAIGVVDWYQRLRSDRPERVSFLQALTAGASGVLVGLLLQEDALLAGAYMASMSLVVNSTTNFRERRTRKRGGTSPEPAPAPPPPNVAPPPNKAPEPDAPAAGEVAPGDEASNAKEAPAEPARVNTRLVRVPEDAIIGGVCAGFARRYGWDVVWVRALTGFGVLLTAGYLALAYVVFWICMPARSASGNAAIARHVRAATRGRAHPVARAFWYGAAILSLGAGISVLGYVFLGLERPWRPVSAARDWTPGLCLVFLGMIAVFYAQTVGRVSTLRRIITLPALLAGLTGTTLAILALPSYQEAAVVALLGASISVWLIFAMVREFRESAPRPSGRVSDVWATSLGTFLMVSAFSIVVVGMIFEVGLGSALSHRGGVSVNWGALEGLTARGYHLATALMLFIPGLSLLLFARRHGGTAHVLRGLLGWLGALFFVGLPAEQIPKGCTVFHDLQIHFQGYESFVLGPSGPRLELLFLALLGLVATLLVAWPSGKDSWSEANAFPVATRSER